MEFGKKELFAGLDPANTEESMERLARSIEVGNGFRAGIIEFDYSGLNQQEQLLLLEVFNTARVNARILMDAAERGTKLLEAAVKG